MQPDYCVRPGDDQDQHLLIAVPRRVDEIRPEQTAVVCVVGVEEIIGNSGADDVARERCRTGNAEHALAQFGDA